MNKIVCPYCGNKAVLSDSSVIYGKSYGQVYLCSNYPVCDAFVGVHKGSVKPLGTLANNELRDLRKRAHNLFDRIWRDKEMSRNGAYRWLADKMGLSRKQTHIAMFNESQCRQVIEIMKERTKDNVINRSMSKVLKVWKNKTSV